MLEVRELSKRFGSITALSDVSLSVASGEIVALVGENGAGKSTVVRCVARALTPDAGFISVGGNRLGRSPRSAIQSGVSVVWQDLALCENLDVTANLFLGRELGWRGALKRAAMHSRAESVFDDLRVSMPELDRPIERLSGGQRQLVAIARATLDEPRVLVLDEPTAALGIAESKTVLGVVKTLQRRGVAILLISHQLDEVFEIADRIVVLRHGMMVADLSKTQTHPDDVVALITGADVESMARQQLRRVHSLAEQLADADQSSILPLTVSSLSNALGSDRLAIYLVSDSPSGIELHCSASLNLPSRLAEGMSIVRFGSTGGFIGVAASDEVLTVAPSLGEMSSDLVASLAAEAGMVGAWAAPIVGQEGSVAVIVGFTDVVAQLQPDQIQLLELFSTMAGAAIERGKLVETLKASNQSLEGLRGILETLAGPDLLRVGMSTALDALCVGVGCDVASLLVELDGAMVRRDSSTGCVDELAAHELIDDVARGDRLANGVVIAPFEWPRGRAAVACCWLESDVPEEALHVIEGAANSFRLAMERELTVEAEREAAALQRSRSLEREFARRLGHELRTPLTAIRGFSSTLLQPDVEWPDDEQQRFLRIIEAESGRMGRLVAQLFDESAIESGSLRLDNNYCDVAAVVGQAISITSQPDAVESSLPDTFTLWGDSDRLEQVFVNLLGNAVRHNPVGTSVCVGFIDRPESAPCVTIFVEDDGSGMPEDVVEFLNGGITDRPKDKGLGIRLVRGFVRAHGGTLCARSSRSGTRVEVTLPIEPALR